MKISILVKVHENLDFGQNCGKFSIFIEVFKKFRFWLKFTKISNLVKKN